MLHHLLTASSWVLLAALSCRRSDARPDAWGRSLRCASRITRTPDGGAWACVAHVQQCHWTTPSATNTVVVTLHRICSNMAHISFSGAMSGQPPLTSASCIVEKRTTMLAGASLTYCWIGRNGCSDGTKFSSLTLVNSDASYASTPRMLPSLPPSPTMRRGRRARPASIGRSTACQQERPLRHSQHVKSCR